MKKKILISFVCIAVLLLSGCAKKNTTPMPGSWNPVTKRMEYPPKDKYEAYYKVKELEAMQPRDFATRTISGVEYIKMKGDNIVIQTRSEYDGYELASSHIAAPKSGYDRTLDTVDRAVPHVLKGFFGWLAYDAFKYNQNKVAKDPVVVKQTDTNTTVNDTMVSSHDVEVVNQQELVVVEKPLVIETETNTINGPVNQGTINQVNNPPPPVPEL